jgi:hypothetical protein
MEEPHRDGEMDPHKEPVSPCFQIGAWSLFLLNHSMKPIKENA